MRKLLTTCVVLSFLVFMAAAMAQTSATSQSSQSGANPSSSQAGSASGQYGSQSSQTGMSSSSTAGEKTVEGCLAREQSDYFLIPRSGAPIKLSSTAGQDLSEHVGHKVKVKGNETMASSAGAGSSTTAGTSGAAAGTSAGTQPSGTEQSGAIGSQAGTSSAGTSGMTSGTGNDLHRLSDRDMTVDKITHVANSCPVNWNPSVPSSSYSSPSSMSPSGASSGTNPSGTYGSSNPSSGTSGETTPPTR